MCDDNPQAVRTPPPGAGAPFHRRAAFSVIELLVVIAVIALLVAIALPVLSTVRRAGKSAACLSNLHQISAGFASYTAANHHLFPDQLTPTPWDQLLLEHLENPKVMLCPADADATDQAMKLSYAWRSGLQSPDPDTNLWGRDVTTISQTDLILVFESEPDRHAVGFSNAADLAAATRSMTTISLHEDLRRYVK